MNVRAQLVLLLLCGPTAVALAQSAGDVATGAPYEDRLIDGGTLPADVSAGDAPSDGSGWPRSIRAEAVTSRVTRGDYDQDESGLRINAMLDTPNFGALTLDANLRASKVPIIGSDTGSLVTLYQFGLPMDGGWRVNNALGVSNVASVDLARQQQRFWVPSILQNGLSTDWRNASGLQLQASVGRPGLLTGLYVPTFEDLGGLQVGAGAQWNDSSGWSAALQAVDVNDVQIGLGPLNSMRTLSGQSWLGSVGWSLSDVRLQASAVSSSLDDRSSGIGAWVDAAIRSGRVQHTFGVFRFDPDLFWGNQPLTSNHQGVYYRAAFQSRRWVVDGGLDYADRVSGDSDDTIFATSYARYQWNARTGFGGGLNMRRSSNEAWSTFAFIDHANSLGMGRVQADHASDELRERTQLTLNQTWDMPAGTRLGNSLIVGRESFAGEDLDLVGIAVNGGGNLRGNLSVDVNARWDYISGSEHSNNILVNFALNWSFAPGWSLGANYYVSQNSWRTPLDVTSPIDNLPLVVEGRTNDKGYFITVRRQWQAGSRQVPLGGAAGSGSGNIDGFLFLDENENGIMDAGERGAPNVVVLLNGRFAARTNPDGRFEFQSVAAGSHVLNVVQDNLPLPWTVPDDGKTNITVNVRQRSFVTIGARRQR
ncbi:MAG: hypothetical protein RL030_2079 [Pseudomonadota bacterium]